MKRLIIILSCLFLVFSGLIVYKVKVNLDQKAALTSQSGQQGQGGRGGRGRADRGAVVRVQAAKRESIVETLRVVGEITPDVEIQIQPRINGRLISLLVEEGQEVKAGQLVAVMDDENIRLQIQQSEANIATYQANLRQAELNLAKAKTEQERYLELLEKKYIPQRDYDNVESAYLSANTAVEVLKAQLSGAQKNHQLLKLQLEQTKIVSPATGYVLKKHVSVGMNLTTGTTIFTIAALNNVKIKFSVDQREAAKIKKDTEVRFLTDAYPGEVFAGKIKEIAPIFDSQTRALTFSVLISNPNLKLVPGMFGTAEVVVGENVDSIVVPQDALVQQEGKQGVFIVTPEQTAKFTPVTTGITAEGRMEILNGLDEGDSVVVVGQNVLKDGQSVQILEGRPTKAGNFQPGQNSGSKTKPEFNNKKNERSEKGPDFNRERRQGSEGERSARKGGSAQ
ncbi:MAG TPA: efflux RND transporter periplasmic adaptor subunit [Bacillota bacterium]|nr:efflux RND transporter periplasmic adaptor subunit [Bacillota bacterium]HOL08809.1 efflux RND transporter periplasmic adaptor subunit [Bacillota bacterium]HPO96899.1 efflux RND transporter periplasmic adaptor subunit [Bacillota bacterium]